MPSRKSRKARKNDEVKFQSNWTQINDDFHGMGLKEKLLRGIFAYGLERPSPVQERAIVPLLEGHDLVMQAQSGTGKTGAFVIGILQQIDMAVKAPQALILAPTHELAQQTQSVVRAIGQYLNVECYSCIGGRKVSHDKKALAKGVHVVVGTPGRLLDLIDKKALILDKVQIFCLDEADEMLSGTFKQQIKDVFSYLEPRKESLQVVLLSATFPDSFHSITRRVMKKTSPPIKILVKRGQLTLEGIQQFFILMESAEWKLDTLCDLYNSDTFTHPTVVFCNSRNRVDTLVSNLETRVIPAASTHGTRLQRERERNLRDFRSGTSRFLITTDMLARGIDVQQVAVVINYEIPQNKELYMHRIGRSGRFGRKGIAINFITKAEIQKMRDIEEYYSTNIEAMPDNVASMISRISLVD